MSGLVNSAKTRYQPIFWHCLRAVIQYLTIFYENQHLILKSWLKTVKIPTKLAIFSIFRYRKYSKESINLFEIEFFFIGNIRQFISNSNTSNTKYFYDWPISNASNTPISNYFLTVLTKKEFTVSNVCTKFQNPRCISALVPEKSLTISLCITLEWEMEKRKNGKRRQKLITEFWFSFSQYTWPLSRYIQNLKNLAVIGAENSVTKSFIGEKEKWTNKGNDKQ